MILKEKLSSAFNMSMGYIPVIITIILCEFISQDTAIYIGTGIGIIGIYHAHQSKGVLLPNFILYISTLMLAILAIAVLIPGEYIPDGSLPLTLEVTIIIPLLILYMHKKQFINYYMKQIGICQKRLHAQAAEASIVSARITLIVGFLHFMIISIIVAVQNPVSRTSMIVIYKVLPPVVFLLAILFNLLAIRIFNFLLSHVEYVPIVNTKGDVIGKTTAAEAISNKNSYINPVIRVAVISHGMLLLYNRPSTTALEKGKTDVPIEYYLHYGESLTDGVKHVISETFPSGTEIQPEFSIVYHFENEVTNRLIYLYIVDIKDDSSLSSTSYENGKLWSFKQIEENLNKNYFSACFEEEYEHLKSVIYTREKYKES